MSRLRGAVFGCGTISEFHLRGWQRIPEVEIVALGNRTQSRAEARRDQFFPQARVYDRLDRILDTERLDFIDLLTIPSLHGEHCRMAKAASVHIIYQKPFCDTWARHWGRWQAALIFEPATVLAWQRRRFREHWTRLSRREPGRPAVSQEPRTLIQDLSAANPRWGLPRNLGKLRKLGIAVAKSRTTASARAGHPHRR